MFILVPYDQDDYIRIMTDTLKGVIPQWRSFAEQLGLDNEEIQEIRGNAGSTHTSFSDLLEKWIELRGKEANISNIIKACERIGNVDLANKLKKDEEMCLLFLGMSRDDLFINNLGSREAQAPQFFYACRIL